MKGYKVPAIMAPPRPLVDNSMKVSFTTKELSDEEMMEIIKYKNKEGWLLFSENEIQDVEIPKSKAEVGQKTPSQRFYNVLFVEWTQKGEQGEFQQFYNIEMDKRIDEVKAKLV